MFLFVIFLLLISVFILRLNKFKKCSLLLAYLTAAFFVASSYGLTLSFFTDQLQTYPRLTNFKWSDHNVIVVLGSGLTTWPDSKELTLTQSVSTRILEGLHQYQNCKKSKNTCTLLFTGGDPRRIGTSEALIMKQAALDSSVPEEDILIEDKSFDTEQNAAFTAALLEQYRYDQLVLVTSGFHMKRSMKWFQQAGLKATAAPADRLAPSIGFLPYARNLYYLDLSLHEVGGLIEFYLKTLF